jgi:hypothetical protein
MSVLDDVEEAVKAIPETEVDGGLVMLAGVLLQCAGKLQCASVTVRTHEGLERAIAEAERTRDQLKVVALSLEKSIEVSGMLIEKLKEYAKDG